MAGILTVSDFRVRDVAAGTTAWLPYDQLVLAPGAVPLRPRLPGVDLPGIFTVRNMDDVDRIHAWIGGHQVNRG